MPDEIARGDTPGSDADASPRAKHPYHNLDSHNRI